MSNPRGRPKQRELVVSPEQKIALRQLLQQPRSSRSLAFRARIVLECASGESNAAVAAKLRTTGFTVGLWRRAAMSLISKSARVLATHTALVALRWQKGLTTSDLSDHISQHFGK